MKLLALRIDGFGALENRTFAFAPGLNVIVGPNEAGKSTLAAAIVASLYGVGRRRDFWRPWSGARYGATLTCELVDGRTLEIVRDFERDPKGARVFDRNGGDVTSEMAEGKTIAPGAVVLRLPHEVYVNAACVPQQDVAIDGTRAPRITATLAQALDGGPRDDAALGALERLDAALRKHVGTAKATKNAPLRTAIERAETCAIDAERARTELGRLGEIRARLEARVQERDALAAAAAEQARRARARHAATLRGRLIGLHDVQHELAAIAEQRARYDDVASYDTDRVAALETRFDEWRRSESSALAAQAQAHASALDDAELRELADGASDVASIDDDAYAALEGAAGDAQRAAAERDDALGAAALARREAESGATLLGGELTAAALFALAAIATAIAHQWPSAGACAALALVIGIVAWLAVRSRSERRRAAESAQRRADDATAVERRAAATVAAVLDPLGLANVELLRHRRERWLALEGRRRVWEEARADADAAHAADARAADAFDRVAMELVGSSFASREEARRRAQHLAARRRERDGLDAALRLHEVRRDAILGRDQEYELRAEFDALLAAGIEPAIAEDTSERELADERAVTDARLRTCEFAVSELSAELRAAEAHVADLAALDDAVLQARAEVERLQSFERAVRLAQTTLLERTREMHEKFARRLEDYAMPHVQAITGGRYGAIFVDPSTLAIRVRVAASNAIVELDSLSVGTREQLYLIVRFAMTRMFAEGLETPPLVLDDPFATWDAQRIDRCLPILVRGTLDAQAIVLTASTELAGAAEDAGAARIDLAAPTYV